MYFYLCARERKSLRKKINDAKWLRFLLSLSRTHTSLWLGYYTITNDHRGDFLLSKSAALKRASPRVHRRQKRYADY